MSVLYFDLVAGISGDMAVAALLDLGADHRVLKRELNKIKIKGYSLRESRVQRGHIRALKWDVRILANKNYSYGQIVRLIRSSRLKAEVKQNVLKVYQALRDAEVQAHGHKHRDIEFQQLGDIDSIVDIASLCIALEQLKADKVTYGIVPLNYKVAPATKELLCGKQVYFTGEIFENVTPTGMAILSALGEQVAGPQRHAFIAGRSGYGAGTLDPSGVTNVVSVMELKETKLDTDEVICVQANIDDMNPQFFDYAFDRFFEAGALDAFVENIVMKKTRPGFLLTVLSNEENLGKISTLILNETTTSGVRFFPLKRLKLKREIRSVDLKGRKVRVKVFELPGKGLRIMPEYEDVKVLAREARIPVQKIYNEVKHKAEIKWHSQD